MLKEKIIALGVTSLILVAALTFDYSYFSSSTTPSGTPTESLPGGYKSPYIPKPTKSPTSNASQAEESLPTAFTTDMKLALDQTEQEHTNLFQNFINLYCRDPQAYSCNISHFYFLPNALSIHVYSSGDSFSVRSSLNSQWAVVGTISSTEQEVVCEVSTGILSTTQTSISYTVKCS